MRIRLASLDDADGIARVHMDSWRAAYKGIVPDAHLASLSYEQRAACWRDNLTTANRNTFVCVAEGAYGRIIGFTGGGPERDGDPNYTGELYALYLHPDYFRQGIGKQLVQTVAHRLIQDGMSSMLVWVLAQNPARAFYEALGGRYLYEKPIEIGEANLIEVAYGWPDIHALAQMEATT
jgi:ribosomal protein S18 acetylase RimI-like enzyme